MDQTVDETDQAYFTCQATGDPIPTISWYFNGCGPLNGTTQYEISVEGIDNSTNSSTLIIYYVQSSDVGTYTCNATNVVSTDTSSGVLTVNGKLLLAIYHIAQKFDGEKL